MSSRRPARRRKTPLQREWTKYVKSKGLPAPGENPCSGLKSDECEEEPICKYRDDSGCGFRKGARKYLGLSSRGTSPREYWNRYAELHGVPQDKCTADYEHKKKCAQPYCYWRTGPRSATCATRRSVPENWPVRGRRPRASSSSGKRRRKSKAKSKSSSSRSAKGKAPRRRRTPSVSAQSEAKRAPVRRRTPSVSARSEAKRAPVRRRKSSVSARSEAKQASARRRVQQPAGPRVRRQVSEIEARERAAAPRAPTGRYGLRTAGQRRRPEYLIEQAEIDGYYGDY
jgi:hypothetical protein